MNELAELSRRIAELEKSETERQRGEGERVKGEMNVQRILDNMLEGCIIIGFDWSYLYVNSVAARHGHQNREKLIGRSMLEMYPGVEEELYLRRLPPLHGGACPTAVRVRVHIPGWSHQLVRAQC